MNPCCPSMNMVGEEVINSYDSYRKSVDLLANHIMAQIDGYVVYIVEADKDLFHIHFCNEDRQKDKILVVQKEQLACIHQVLKEFLPNLC